MLSTITLLNVPSLSECHTSGIYLDLGLALEGGIYG